MNKSVEYRCEVITRKGRRYALQDGKLVGIDSKKYLSRGYASAKWEYLRAIENNDPRIETVMVIKNEFDGDILERSEVVESLEVKGV